MILQWRRGAPRLTGSSANLAIPVVVEKFFFHPQRCSMGPHYCWETNMRKMKSPDRPIRMPILASSEQPATGDVMVDCRACGKTLYEYEDEIEKIWAKGGCVM